MCAHCPRCRYTLPIDPSILRSDIICPSCQTVLPAGSILTASGIGASRTLLAAIDVLTSAKPFLARMQNELVNYFTQLQQETVAQTCCFLFHRKVIPFPCEQLCYARQGERGLLPTLQDLRLHVAPGSAILDALYRLLCEAESQPSDHCDLLLLTDGCERSSQRHEEEIRQKLAELEAGSSVRILVFTDGLNNTSLINLVRRLATPRLMWSVFWDESRLATRRTFGAGLAPTQRTYFNTVRMSNN